MRQYIIANTPDYQTFDACYKQLAAKGVPFTTDYIEKFTDAPAPGGWGCLRFEIPLPSETAFPAPSIEYRFSEELGVWTVDGQPSPLTHFVDGVKDYFDSLVGA